MPAYELTFLVPATIVYRVARPLTYAELVDAAVSYTKLLKPTDLRLEPSRAILSSTLLLPSTA